MAFHNHEVLPCESLEVEDWFEIFQGKPSCAEECALSAFQHLKLSTAISIPDGSGCGL